MSNAISSVPEPINDPVRDYLPGSPEREALSQELKARSQHVADVPLLIGERTVMKTQQFKICAPHAHTHHIANCSLADDEDIAQAITQAVTAQKEWSRLPWEQRAAVFLRAADLLEGKYRPAINATTMLGQSKTLYQAEIDAACELIDFLRFNVSYLQDIYEVQPLSVPGVWNRSEYRGLEGFVYAVSPFNFTSLAINLAAAPALMGCCVVWKPAEQAALSAWTGLEVLREAGLPPGVINFVPGDAARVSAKVLAHPDCSGLHFTGSTAVFRRLWAQVGNNIQHYRNYPRLVGETGGKDFVFAHTSADRQSLINHLVRGAFEYQGQKCSAASRAYLPVSVWNDIKDDLVARTREIKMGNPADFSNFIAAVIDAKAFQKITAYIDAARGAEGVEVLVGGGRDDSRGYFIAPTILLTKDPHYRTMREEIFGPVLTVYVYADEDLDRTLALCDTTAAYALTGAIFAQDRRAVQRLSDALCYTAGNFYINDKPTGAIIGQQPFGGGRASGTNDKAGSYLNLTRWMSARTIKETLQPLSTYRYPHMG